MYEKKYHLRYQICIFILGGVVLFGCRGFAQETEPLQVNSEEVQSALDYVEEIREQRNAESQKALSQEKDDLDALVDKIIQEVETSQEKIFIDKIQVEKMPIRQAIKVIAEKIGLKAETEEGLNQEVTLYLNNVELNDLLAIVCDLNSLAYVIEDKTIKLMTLETYEMKYGYKYQKEWETKFIPLKHVNYADILVSLEAKKGPSGEILFDEKSNSLIVKDEPSYVEEITSYLAQIDLYVETKIYEVAPEKIKDMEAAVESLLTPEVGIVSVEQEENKLIVTDVPEKLQEIQKFLEEQENSEKVEVSYQLKALQVTLYEEHEDGVDWDAIVSDYQRIKCLRSEQDSKEEKEFLSLGTVSAEDFDILLEALDTVGEIEILSEVEKNTRSQDVTLSASFKEAELPQGGSIKEAVEKSAALNVHVSLIGIEDDVFSLSLAPCLKEAAKEKDVEKGCNPSEEDFTIQIENGSTIVLGSLVKDVLVESTRKIPLLGDLPFLGFAFRNQGTRMGKSEVIFFVTVTLPEE